MRPLEELGQFVDLMRPLTRPNHSITSLGQLSRFARIQDDKARRVISRMAEACGGDPLVELKGRKYTLTATGRELVSAGERLIAVGRQQDATHLSETLTVEISPEITPQFLTEPLDRFLEEWSGLITVRILPLDHELRTNLCAYTAFGVGIVEADGSSGAALLERPIPWTVLVPGEHPLADQPTPIPAAELTNSGRVFVPAEFAETLAAGLVGGSSVIIVPTGEAVRAAVAGRLGNGLDPDFGCAGEPEPFFRLPTMGFKPLRIGIFLPRKPESMSEAAKCLLSLIRSPRKTTVTAQTTSAAGDEQPVDAEPLTA